MLHIWISRLRLSLVAVLTSLAVASPSSPVPSGHPSVDKTKLEAYIRYAEGFTKEVQIAVDDPIASSYPGLFRVGVHLTAGRQKLDKLYYVSPDGQRVISGNVWQLGQNPFQETLSRLPNDGPSFGPAKAPVTIVIFSDFECPYCRELAKTVRDNIPKNYPQDVRVVFENFPIESIHPWARPAAEAGACIASQKPEAFWTFHDWIYEHQGEVNPSNVNSKVGEFAKTAGLDGLQLSSCISNHETAAQIGKNEQAGQALQISRTPTLFVNGRMIQSALPWNDLDAVIKLELNRPRDIAAANLAEKCCEVTIPQVAK